MSRGRSISIVDRPAGLTGRLEVEDEARRAAWPGRLMAADWWQTSSSTIIAWEHRDRVSVAAPVSGPQGRSGSDRPKF